MAFNVRKPCEGKDESCPTPPAPLQQVNKRHFGGTAIPFTRHTALIWLDRGNLEAVLRVKWVNCNPPHMSERRLRIRWWVWSSKPTNLVIPTSSHEARASDAQGRMTMIGLRSTDNGNADRLGLQPSTSVVTELGSQEIESAACIFSICRKPRLHNMGLSSCNRGPFLAKTLNTERGAFSLTA